MSKQAVTFACLQHPTGLWAQAMLPLNLQRQGKPHKSTKERKSHTSRHPPFRDCSMKQRKASSLRCRRLLKASLPGCICLFILTNTSMLLCPAEEIPAIWACLAL